MNNRPEARTILHIYADDLLTTWQASQMPFRLCQEKYQQNGNTGNGLTYLGVQIRDGRPVNGNQPDSQGPKRDHVVDQQ